MVYLDANVIIRLVEGDDAVREPIERRIVNENIIVTSLLSKIECRCKPLRAGDTGLLQIFETFFSGSQLRLIEIDINVIDQATHIRAHSRFKIPDSIHLATAIISGASVFLTADAELRKFGGVVVESV